MGDTEDTDEKCIVASRRSNSQMRVSDVNDTVETTEKYRDAFRCAEM